MIKDSNRFETIIHLIDEANKADPNQEKWQDSLHPKEWLYSQRMTAWLQHIYPTASEELQLAAHAQHICRWTIPRSAYPMDKVGYHKWRKDLQFFHADKAADLMAQAGYDTERIQKVQALLQKKDLRKDPVCQQLEDVICLVFLDHYFDAFAEKHADDKVIAILQKTWRKMTATGQAEALKIKFPTRAEALLQQALS